MSGPWIFSTLVGLLVLVQLCNARLLAKPPGSDLDLKEDTSNRYLLNRIMTNVRRIGDILAFQILDQEDQRITLEQKRAATNSKRKCTLQSLVMGKSSSHCPGLFGHVVVSRRSYSPRKRRPNNNTDSNSNSNSISNTNINKNSIGKGDALLRSENPLKKIYPKGMKTLSHKSPKRVKPGYIKAAANKNTNTNKNININLNDEIESQDFFNDEINGLSVLSDTDDGPGDLNDEVVENGLLNDEVDGPGALNDEIDLPGPVNDELDGPGALNDEDGPKAFNDEDDLGTLNQEDGHGALNDDEEQFADEFDK